ncbi:MAG: hydroxyisourate hydrolase [Actinomycetota bacterium]|nr:hydroxyisourate hydrolase [Actinomycetota bacterium]
MSSISTHVLDTAQGCPGEGIAVRLERWPAPAETIASAVTDRDGRVGQLGTGDLDKGTYRLVLDTAAYFARTGTPTFFPTVEIAFSVSDPGSNYHVPVLLSPFAFSTYRGS